MNSLVKQLRSRRISVTPQRLAILANLEARRDHPTAEQIYQDVRREMPTISFNTVYKTLEVFCQKGLIIKVNPLHEVARYDYHTEQHAHLICRNCRFIVDLPDEVAPVPTLSPEAQAGFQVEQYSLIYWGLCPKCQQSEATARRT
ncbi:MAG: Fur family transcriptional regulator [Desulfobaccales bacterium]